MISYFLQNSSHVTEVSVTFLLPGHTMMPVDSIHSTIESFIDRRVVWAPSEWATMITNSRTDPKNYEVIELSHLDFRDWKNFSASLIPAKIKIQFSELRKATFEKDVITFKYGFFEDSREQTINLNQIIRSRQNRTATSTLPPTIYQTKLNISKAKFDDLKSLCDKGTIPERFHGEYFNIPYEGAVLDTLPETDEDDESE